MGYIEAGRYYVKCWEETLGAVEESYGRLVRDYEIIIAEGAGNIAEINLEDSDPANLRIVRLANADILLAGDIEIGGVFASVYGKIDPLPEEIKDKVVNVVINKFRGTNPSKE